MNKEVLTNKEVSDALHCLFHCARKDSNYETQYEQFRLVYDYINQLETNRDEAIEYLTSYEAIHTIQFGVEEVDEKDLYNNKGLDEKTITEMTNRYLKVHDKLLSLLERGKE